MMRLSGRQFSEEVGGGGFFRTGEASACAECSPLCASRALPLLLSAARAVTRAHPLKHIDGRLSYGMQIRLQC